MGLDVATSAGGECPVGGASAEVVADEGSDFVCEWDLASVSAFAVDGDAIYVGVGACRTVFDIEDAGSSGKR